MSNHYSIDCVGLAAEVLRESGHFTHERARILGSEIQDAIDMYIENLPAIPEVPSMDDDGNHTYVTIKEAVNRRNHYNVLVMEWNEREQEHCLTRASLQLPRGQAEALAKSWAAALQVEVL